MFSEIKSKSVLIVLLGSLILAFGLYNIHSFSGVTEGGGLGLVLLLDHWFHISPAITSFIFNIVCYFSGWKVMGKNFIIYSMISSISFSIFYSMWEGIGPFFPEIGSHPLLASLAGALFVGIGCGLSVRMGGASGGDDALAMTLSKVTGFKIQWIYLVSDLLVLLLSLTYIPIGRIGYSLLTVILSGQLIGLIQDFRWPSQKAASVETDI